MSVPHVYILACCPSPEHLKNTLLVFDTLRVGFPTAKITVVDNASHPATVPAIEQAAAGVEAGFLRYANRIEHGRFINDVIAREEGPVVFLDTDIIFWANCEDFAVPADVLLSGRFMPKLGSATAIHLPRVHLSFLIVTDAAELRRELSIHAKANWYFRGFEGYTTVMDGKMLIADEGATVVALLGDRVWYFQPEFLDRYDHLFMGTIPEWIDAVGLPQQLADVIREGHSLVDTPEKLKGIWRKQQGANISWSYLAGRIIAAGKEYGVFVARFHDILNGEHFAHAGVTNYTDGTFVGGPVEIVSNTVVRAPWGTIELEPLATGNGVTLPNRTYGEGRTDAYVAPGMSAICRVTLPGCLAFVARGDFWYEQETGLVPPGSGWVWTGLRLLDGRAYTVRTEGGVTEFLCHTTDGCRKIDGIVHEDGLELEGRRYTFVFGPQGTVIDAVRNMHYAETYVAVYDEGGRRCGFAFVETVPVGNGTPAAGPALDEMFLRWARGNDEAADVVRTLWRASQIADDLVDGDTPKRLESPAVMELILTGAVGLHNNRFYREHRGYLEPLITNALLFWDASNAWAVSNRRDTQIFGYAYREAFGTVIVAVAYLTGGLEFARNVLRELHAYLHDSGRVESFDQWRKEQHHG